MSADAVQAVVVGSGYGGAAAALRLGSAGVETIVLEQGRRWEIRPDGDTFASLRAPDGRAAFLSPRAVDPINEGVKIDVHAGILSRVSGSGVDVLCGVGVGGGSLINFAATYQPRKEHFQRVFGERLFDWDELESEYFPLAHRQLQSTVFPEDIAEHDSFVGTRVFRDIAHAADMPFRWLEMQLGWDAMRAELTGEAVPSATSGDCWYGYNSGAKLSVDRTLLAEAEQLRNVEVRPLHIVTDLGETGDGRLEVRFREIDVDGCPVSAGTLVAESVFLAAGSMGSTKLLLRGRATGTLSRLAGDVGGQWGMNGDMTTVASGLGRTNPAGGGPMGGVVESLDVETGPTVVQNGPLWGGDEGTLVLFAMGDPAGALGRLRYDPAGDDLSIEFPHEHPGISRMLDAADDLYQRIGAAAGIPLNAPRPRWTWTGHPCGGIAAGTVADSSGRVIGYDNLFVVDGAFIPGSAGCANPSLTIVALANRTLDCFLRSSGLAG